MFCDCHTHSINDKNKFIIDISENYQLSEKVDSFSVGIHPKTEKTDIQLADNFRIISLLAQKDNCAAIGECGFDKFSALDIKKQEDIFRRQITVAQQFNKPLIIHCVRLYSEIIRLLKLTKFSNPVIFHCYNGNTETTRQLLKNNNVYFSFSETNIAEKCNGFKSLEIIPIDKILTESDCNENIDFETVISIISNKKNISYSKMEQQIADNFKFCFNL